MQLVANLPYAARVRAPPILHNSPTPMCAFGHSGMRCWLGAATASRRLACRCCSSKLATFPTCLFPVSTGALFPARLSFESCMCVLWRHGDPCSNRLRDVMHVHTMCPPLCKHGMLREAPWTSNAQFKYMQAPQETGSAHSVAGARAHE
eukprot:6173032-Pleurochrysis_carterae.AAC.6